MSEWNCRHCGGTKQYHAPDCEVLEYTAPMAKRIRVLEALLREVTTSIEFDELGLRGLRERIVLELVP